MWKIIADDDSVEPPELRELKINLANNTCKCILCLKHSSLLDTPGCYEKEIQVKNSRVLSDRFPITNHSTSLKNQNLFHNDALCPGCHIAMAMNLLCNKETKVLKDVELETKSETSDKATEKAVESEEKTTSTIEELKNDSELSFNDMISEYSTDMSSCFTKYRKRHEKVTFEEIPMQSTKISAISRNLLGKLG